MMYYKRSLKRGAGIVEEEKLGIDDFITGPVGPRVRQLSATFGFNH